MTEWQRDWGTAGTVSAFAEVTVAHAGGTGVALFWQKQLLEAGVRK